MTATLPAVGCIGLFGGDATPMERAAHPSCISIRASAKTTTPHHHVTQPPKLRGARQRIRRTTSAANTGALSRTAPETQLLSFVGRNLRGQRGKALQLCFCHKPPNARHHPRPRATYMRGALKGRRVHAVVRLRACEHSRRICFDTTHSTFAATTRDSASSAQIQSKHRRLRFYTPSGL